MTYNLYMLSKWTAEVANCVLEGLLGEYHISYHIILFPITYPWTPIFFIKAVNGWTNISVDSNFALTLESAAGEGDICGVWEVIFLTSSNFHCGV